MTVGKQDVTVKNAPSSLVRAIAGATGARSLVRASAAPSVSGRTPSAMMMMTGTSIQVRDSIENSPDGSPLRKPRTRASWNRGNLLANAPSGRIDLSHSATRSRASVALAMSDQHLNAIQKQD